jgi:hypothetical protein
MAIDPLRATRLNGIGGEDDAQRSDGWTWHKKDWQCIADPSGDFLGGEFNYYDITHDPTPFEPGTRFRNTRTGAEYQPGVGGTVAPETVSETGDRIARMYREGASVSDIALAVGLKRSGVYSAIHRLREMYGEDYIPRRFLGRPAADHPAREYSAFNADVYQRELSELPETLAAADVETLAAADVETLAMWRAGMPYDGIAAHKSLSVARIRGIIGTMRTRYGAAVVPYQK